MSRFYLYMYCMIKLCFTLLRLSDCSYPWLPALPCSSKNVRVCGVINEAGNLLLNTAALLTHLGIENQITTYHYVCMVSELFYDNTVGRVLIAWFNDYVSGKPGQFVSPIIVRVDPLPYYSIHAHPILLLCL